MLQQVDELMEDLLRLRALVDDAVKANSNPSEEAHVILVAIECKFEDLSEAVGKHWNLRLPVHPDDTSTMS